MDHYINIKNIIIICLICINITTFVFQQNAINYLNDRIYDLDCEIEMVKADVRELLNVELRLLQLFEEE